MHIAITGANGFIARRLIASLKSTHPDATFTLLDIQKSHDDITIADVTNSDTMLTHLKGADIIYHLAAEHRDDVSPIQKYYDTNVGSAKTITAAARKHGIKTIIFTSTVAVYGLNAGESVETDTPAPFNDYGQSKLDAEKIFEDWASETQDNSLTTLRLVATFGPGNRGNIHTLMNQVARKKFIMIGNGQNKKSIAYVENTAAFMASFAKNAKKGIQIYNYADKPDLDMTAMMTSIRESFGIRNRVIKAPYIIGIIGGTAFDILAKITGRKFPISKIRVQKFCANTTVNAAKAHKTFKAPHTITEGLTAMIKTDFNE